MEFLLFYYDCFLKATTQPEIRLAKRVGLPKEVVAEVNASVLGWEGRNRQDIYQVRHVAQAFARGF